MLIVPRYSDERKAAVLANLSPPHSMTVATLAREEGISDRTLYNSRTQARERRGRTPGARTQSYRGLLKNTAQLFTLFGLANLVLPLWQDSWHYLIINQLGGSGVDSASLF